MAEQTLSELIKSMRDEVKWFRRQSQRHALNANKTVVAITQICELVEQEVHVRVGDKLAEWVERFEKLAVNDGD